MKRLICIYIGLAILTITASAQQKSEGERLYDEGLSQWKEFCTDMTTYEINQISQKLYNAVEKLISEKNKALTCKAALVLSEVLMKDYYSLDDALYLCRQVISIEPDELARDNIVARMMIANILSDYSGELGFRELSGISVESFKQLTAQGDIISFGYLNASLRSSVMDYRLASRYYSLLKKLDYTLLDRYDLVQYLQAMFSYSRFLFQIRGDYEEWLSVFQMCTSIIEQYNLLNSTASINYFREFATLNYFTKDYEKALESATLAMQIAEKHLGVTSIAAASSITEVSKYLALTKDYTSAKDLLSAYLHLLDEMNKTEGSQYYSMTNALGDILLTEGHFSEAAETFKHCAQLSTKLYNNAYFALNENATALFKNGDKAGAVIVGNEALSDFRKYIGQVFLSLAENSRELFWSSSGYRFINRLLNSIDPDFDTSGLLFDVALVSKGLLTNSCARALDKASTNDDPEYNKLLNRYISLQYRLEDLKATQSHNEELVNSVLENLRLAEAELTAKYNVFEEEFSWFSYTWKDVSAHLQKDEAAIEFIRFYNYETKKREYIASVLVSDSAPVSIRLNDVDEEVINALTFEDKYSSNKLYELFIQPLERALRGRKKVYYSPIGIMNSLALESVTPKVQLIRLSSTRQLINSRKKTEWDKAILFGGIDYNVGLDEMEYYSTEASESKSRSGSNSWAFLPGSLDEIELLFELIPARQKKKITGGEGVEESFKALSGKGVSVIHVATHGFFDYTAIEKNENKRLSRDDQTMYESGLVFAGANNLLPDGSELEDGLLYSAEISRLNLTGCDLVVLSACETGTVSADRFTEVFGLLRAFKKAGCQSILMTLWEVDDYATSAFMECFYNGVSQGKNKNEALTLARNHLRSLYPDPKYWAPFILID